MSRFQCEAPNCEMRTWDITEEQERLATSKCIVSFHKFPPDIDRQNSWKNAMGKQNCKVNFNSVVCSLHFKSECYDKNNRLLYNAVPSIFFDNFQSHLKLILDTLERKNEKSDSDSDDEIRIEISNSDSTPAANDKIHENSASALSDSDDFDEIECEEIILSGDDLDELDDLDDLDDSSKHSDDEDAVTKSATKSPEPKPVVTIDDSASPPRPSIASARSRPKRTPPKQKTEENIISEKNQENREATTEKARQLYSMIQSGNYKNFSIMQPASKDLVHQLLEIVKMAQNTGDPLTEEKIPSTYIITSKIDDPPPGKTVKTLETKDVIDLITQTTQSIKNGTFENTGDLTIICGSPAIFLLKHISVRNFDAHMNAVYVITSENLLPFLYLLSTKPKPSTPAALVKSISSRPVAPSALPSTETRPQTPPSTIRTPGTPNTSRSVAPLQSAPARNVQLASLSSSKVSFVRQMNPIARMPPVAVASSVLVNIQRPVLPRSNAASFVAQRFSTMPVTIPSDISAFRTPSIIAQSRSFRPSEPTTVTAQLSTTPKLVTIANDPFRPIASKANLSTPIAAPTAILMPIAGVPFKAIMSTLPPAKTGLDAAAHLTSAVVATTPASRVPISTASTSKTAVTTALGRKNMITIPSTSKAPAATPWLNKTPAAALSSSKTLVTTPATSKIATTPFSKSRVPVTIPLKRKADAAIAPTSPKRSAHATASTNGIVGDEHEPSVLTIDLADCILSPAKSGDRAGGEPAAAQRTPVAAQPRRSAAEWALPGDAVAAQPLAAAASDGRAEEITLSPESARRLLTNQRAEIRALEEKITRKEREILALRKRAPQLKKRRATLRQRQLPNAKTDLELVDDILRKHLEADAVQFFLCQMKVAGKTFTQYRWSEEDKLFALSLLYKNPTEYNALFQRFTLPSDKTLTKFVARVKKAEMEARN